mgnify:CR=1 FL=1
MLKDKFFDEIAGKMLVQTDDRQHNIWDRYLFSTTVQSLVEHKLFTSIRRTHLFARC